MSVNKTGTQSQLVVTTNSSNISRATYPKWELETQTQSILNDVLACFPSTWVQNKEKTEAIRHQIVESENDVEIKHRITQFIFDELKEINDNEELKQVGERAKNKNLPKYIRGAICRARIEVLLNQTKLHAQQPVLLFELQTLNYTIIDELLELNQITATISAVDKDFGGRFVEYREKIKAKILVMDPPEKALNYLDKLTNLATKGQLLSRAFMENNTFYEKVLEHILDVRSLKWLLEYSGKHHDFKIKTQLGEKTPGKDLISIYFGKMKRDAIYGFFNSLLELHDKKAALHILKHVSSLLYKNAGSNPQWFLCVISQIIVCRSEITKHFFDQELSDQINVEILKFISKITNDYYAKKTDTTSNPGCKVVNLLLIAKLPLLAIYALQKIADIEKTVSVITTEDRQEFQNYVSQATDMSLSLENLEVKLAHLERLKNLLGTTAIAIRNNLIDEAIMTGNLSGLIDYAAQQDTGIADELVTKEFLSRNSFMAGLCFKILCEQEHFVPFLKLIQRMPNQLLAMRTLCHLGQYKYSGEIDQEWFQNHAFPQILVFEEKIQKTTQEMQRLSQCLENEVRKEISKLAFAAAKQIADAVYTKSI